MKLLSLLVGLCLPLLIDSFAPTIRSVRRNSSTRCFVFGDSLKKTLFGKSRVVKQKNGGIYLIDAGLQLKTAPAGVLPTLLKEAGESMVDVGSSWESSWEAVAYASDETAQVFKELALTARNPELARLYAATSSEWKAMASISERSKRSAAPANSLKNISKNLKNVAKYYNSNGGDGKEIAKAMRGASKLIQTMAKECGKQVPKP